MTSLLSSYTNLPPVFFKDQNPEKVPHPTLLFFNHKLAQELSFETSSWSDEDLAQIFSGNRLLENTRPIALAYAGHQFGHFVPQLGDGRALLIAEINNRDVQLKGSGRTFFSRRGDGKSALGPVVREYIVSEAMHHLGIPTTRALAAVATGEMVQRQTMQAAGVFTRVAKSHLRVGSFEFLKAQGDEESLKKLTDYAIERLMPELGSLEDKYLQFFRKVSRNYLSLIAQWMGVGFIHGVMNTDNSSISGETIDYGPCAFMDDFNFNQVFSSIDQNGRYRYAHQPHIGMWNLSSLANCLTALVSVKDLEDELSLLPSFFEDQWLKVMGKKLGVISIGKEVKPLIESWLQYLQKHQLDFTNSYSSLQNLVGEFNPEGNGFVVDSEFNKFLDLWKNQIQSQDITETKKIMSQSNPIYIPRNHLVEKAIELSYAGDYSFAKELMSVLARPYTFQEGKEAFAHSPGKMQSGYKTFCGT